MGISLMYIHVHVHTCMYMHMHMHMYMYLLVNVWSTIESFLDYFEQARAQSVPPSAERAE